MNKLLSIYRKHQEVIKYLFFGCLTTIVSWVFFYGCIWTILDAHNGIQLQIANIISWTGAVLFAYVVNRRFVFESRNPHILPELIAFVGTRVLTLLLDMVVMWLLVTALHGDPNIAKIFATVLVMIGNYIVAKIWVFKNK